MAPMHGTVPLIPARHRPLSPGVPEREIDAFVSRFCPRSIFERHRPSEIGRNMFPSLESQTRSGASKIKPVFLTRQGRQYANSTAIQKSQQAKFLCSADKIFRIIGAKNFKLSCCTVIAKCFDFIVTTNCINPPDDRLLVDDQRLCRDLPVCAACYPPALAHGFGV